MAVTQTSSFKSKHPEITVHLETSTKPFLFNDNIFDAAIFAGTQQQIDHWPGIQAHYLMDEEIVPVCSPRLIEKYFPDAVMINENTYDLSFEDLLKIPYYNKPLGLAFGKNGF